MRPNQSWTARVEAFSTCVSQWAGSTAGFIAALCVVAVWALTGPLFRYSDTWQLIINTITSIVAFVMVFLIQRAQNKDTLAMQIKLNELLAAVKGAADPLVAIEQLSEADLRRLHARYIELARRGDLPSPGSIPSAS